jgi:predicted 3-demethylubiquinone-9 3-methyltransferase (glyoxalase superfamily)
MATIQKIVPCLWFDGEAEDAARFYVSIFEIDSRILRTSRYTHEGQEIHGRDPGSVMTVEFQLAGCELTALNGGPEFKFSEAISLQVLCDTQQEVDRLWEKLSAGGDPKAQQCGWLKDKFGLSWQIVPSILPELMADSDVTKAARTMRALLEMKKLDIAKLQNAHDGTD